MRKESHLRDGLRKGSFFSCALLTVTGARTNRRILVFLMLKSSELKNVRIHLPAFSKKAKASRRNQPRFPSLKPKCRVNFNTSPGMPASGCLSFNVAFHLRSLKYWTNINSLIFISSSQEEGMVEERTIPRTSAGQVCSRSS